MRIHTRKENRKKPAKYRRLCKAVNKMATVLLLCGILLNGINVSARIVEEPADKGGGGQPTAGILPVPAGVYTGGSSGSADPDSSGSTDPGSSGSADSDSSGSADSGSSGSTDPDSSGSTDSGSSGSTDPDSSGSADSDSSGSAESGSSGGTAPDSSGSTGPESTAEGERGTNDDREKDSEGSGTSGEGNGEGTTEGTGEERGGQTGGTGNTVQMTDRVGSGAEITPSGDAGNPAEPVNPDRTEDRTEERMENTQGTASPDENEVTPQAEERESGSSGTEGENEAAVPDHALTIEDREQGVMFYVEETSRNAQVDEAYAPWIDLRNLPEESQVQVYRNGEEIPYSMTEGRLLIRSEDVTEGKNRITVKVTGPDGTVTEMEPWEFYRGDLYENSSYDIIGGQAEGEEKKNAALERGEQALKKKKKQKSVIPFIIVLTLLVGGLALLGYSAWRLIAAQNGGTDSQPSQAEAAPTVAIPTPEPETESVTVPQEAEPSPTPVPTATPTPVPTATPTAEPNPRTERKVAIDPGHQLHGNPEQEPIGPGASASKARVTSGTSGAASGLNEYELNLIVSLKLRDELVRRGYQVYMTREVHEVDISNRERAEAAARENADIFVRIHANGSADPSVAGVLTYEPTSANPFLSANVIAESQRLSETLLKAFIESTGAIDRGIISGDDMSGINWSTMPVTIVELGFMSNPEEDLRMASEEYQEKMVDGLANGIDDYFAIPRMTEEG